MTMSQIQSMHRKAGFSAIPTLHGILGVAWGWLCDIALPRPDLDDLTEAQLGDIGLNRLAYREKWMDCRQTDLTVAFDYRDRPDERAGPHGHAQ